jgi:hypothetical protein
MTTRREPWVGRVPCAFRCGARAVFHYTGWYRTCLACAIARRCVGPRDGARCGQPATQSVPIDAEMALPLCPTCTERWPMPPRHRRTRPITQETTEYPKE